MSKKATVYWCIWIGVLTAIYVFLYLSSPLAQYGIIWVTFIALPIFFNGGAKREDYVPQMVSSCVGVCWGLIMLWFAGVIGAVGGNLAMALSCGLFTICSCTFMMLENKHLINKVPAAFGGISSCFSQGGKNWWVIMITLCLGVTLGLLCNEGGPLCAKWAGDQE